MLFHSQCFFLLSPNLLFLASHAHHLLQLWRHHHNLLFFPFFVFVLWQMLNTLWYIYSHVFLPAHKHHRIGIIFLFIHNYIILRYVEWFGCFYREHIQVFFLPSFLKSLIRLLWQKFAEDAFDVFYKQTYAVKKTNPYLFSVAADFLASNNGKQISLLPFSQKRIEDIYHVLICFLWIYKGNLAIYSQGNIFSMLYIFRVADEDIILLPLGIWQSAHIIQVIMDAKGG